MATIKRCDFCKKDLTDSFDVIKEVGICTKNMKVGESARIANVDSTCTIRALTKYSSDTDYSKVHDYSASDYRFEMCQECYKKLIKAFDTLVQECTQTTLTN